MADEDTILDSREASEFCCPAPSLSRGNFDQTRGRAHREHPLVHAWRHSANMWRDRCHAQEQKAALWRSVSAGLAIGIVLGLTAWRLLP